MQTFNIFFKSGEKLVGCTTLTTSSKMMADFQNREDYPTEYTIGTKTVAFIPSEVKMMFTVPTVETKERIDFLEGGQ